MIEVGI
jgi:hypothetical protein